MAGLECGNVFVDFLPWLRLFLFSVFLRFSLDQRTLYWRWFFNNILLYLRYLQKLSSAMERKFFEQHMVFPSLVEDCGRHVFKLSDNPGLQPRDVIGLVRNMALNQRLFRCMVSTILAPKSNCSVFNLFERRVCYYYAISVTSSQLHNVSLLNLFSLFSIEVIESVKLKKKNLRF